MSSSSSDTQVEAIRLANATLYAPPQTIAATVRGLTHYQSSPPVFLPARLLLIPPGRVDLPNDAIQEYLHVLVQRAHKAASALSCSSILAGHTSEGDDFSDVGIWLGEGDFGKGHELDVLERIGLHSLTNIDLISELALVPPKLIPSTVNIDALTPGDLSLDNFSAHLRSLKDTHIFIVRTGLSPIFVLVGRFEGNGWGGLISKGAWSDE